MEESHEGEGSSAGSAVRRRRMYRIAAVVLVLLAVSAGLGRLYIGGIVVETTPDSFVVRADMPLFEIKDRKMNVRMAAAPAAWPEETRAIYRAASFGVPVKVKLRSQRGMVYFDIDGLSAEGDFLIPCASARICRSILESVQMDVPEELLIQT